MFCSNFTDSGWYNAMCYFIEYSISFLFFSINADLMLLFVNLRLWLYEFLGIIGKYSQTALWKECLTRSGGRSRNWRGYPELRAALWQLTEFRLIHISLGEICNSVRLVRNIWIIFESLTMIGLCLLSNEFCALWL